VEILLELVERGAGRLRDLVVEVEDRLLVGRDELLGLYHRVLGALLQGRVAGDRRADPRDRVQGAGQELLAARDRGEVGDRGGRGFTAFQRLQAWAERAGPERTQRFHCGLLGCVSSEDRYSSAVWSSRADCGAHRRRNPGAKRRPAGGFSTSHAAAWAFAR